MLCFVILIQTYTADLFYHQFWTDYRIKIPPGLEMGKRVVLDHQWKNKLWVPDTYFKQSNDGSLTNVIFPSLYFNIYNESEVFMAAR